MTGGGGGYLVIGNDVGGGKEMARSSGNVNGRQTDQETNIIQLYYYY